MPYLTYEEYQTLGTSDVSEQDFPKILAKASDVVDSVTRSFYRFNNLDDDRSEWRRKQFKKAVAAQMDYFIDMGGVSSHELNSPLSVTLGRTQISSGERNQRQMNNIVSNDVYMLLRDTGLLYRGVATL